MERWKDNVGSQFAVRYSQFGVCCSGFAVRMCESRLASCPGGAFARQGGLSGESRIPNPEPRTPFRQAKAFLIRLMYPVWLLFFLSACTVRLDVELEPEEEILVTYALFNCLDSATTAIVESSIGFEETFNLNRSKLDGPATVQLFRAGELWAEYGQEGQSVYYSAGHPPIGLGQQEWEMVVSHPGFGEARAKGRPPVPGTVLSARLLPEYVLPDGSRRDGVLEVKILDPSGGRNYYELALLNGPADSLQTVFLASLFLVETADTSFYPTASFGLGDRWLFSDEVGDGQEITLAFQTGSPAEGLEQPRLSIRYVSEAYYLYLKSLLNSGEPLLEPFQGGRGRYSNFGRNFGVFALYVEEVVPVSN